MKSVLRRVFRVFWYLVAALVITTAVLTSAARFLFPVVSGYRADVEAWVSQRVGEPVRIGSLRATWQGLDPVIRFGGVRVLDHQNGRVLLAARELRITLSLWGSIQARRPVAGGITVVGTRLDVERLPNGRIVLRGFEDRPVRDLPLAALLNREHAAIVQSTVSWTNVGESDGPMRFRDVNVRLTNRGDRHRLDGEVLLPPALGRAVSFSAHLTGSLQRLRDWQGTVYMQGQGLRLGAWTAGREPAGLSLAGTADLSLWADVRASRLAALTGVTSASGLEVAGHAHRGGGPVHFSTLHGRFRWQRVADGWRLDVDRLQVAADGTQWPQTAISVAAGKPDGGDARQWRARVRYGDVGLLRRLAVDTDLLSPGVRRSLVGLRPVGHVRDLQLALVESGGNIRQLDLKGAFHGLGVRRWGRYPAVTGLSGSARGSLDSGAVVLNSDDASLGDPRLFSAPMVADRLAGTVRWRRYGDRLRLQTGELELDNQDLHTRSRIRLDIPNDGSSPLLDMQVAFGDGDVSRVGHYLPEGAMPAPAVRWLRRSLVKGRITSGTLLFHGRLAAFPFVNHDGVFQVAFNVRDGVLDYRPGWPRIDHLGARVEFVGHSMDLQAQSADVLGAELKHVRASIPDLHHPRLRVTGRATGALSSMLGFLRASPLGRRYTGVLGNVRSTGSASVDLSLDVPLHGARRQVSAKGSVHLPGNALAFNDWQHEGLTDLRGTLHFDGRKLSARGVHAQFLQRPVRISVSTDNPDGQSPQTRVALTGRLPLVERLRKSDPALARYASGSTDWRLLLAVPRVARGNDQPSAQLTLESDLKGVSVHLPSPLGKAADERRDFVLHTTVSGQGANPVQVSYGRVLRARLALKRDQGHVRLQRGEVRFGTKPARLPATPGLRVAGDISRLSLSQWVGGGDALLGGAGAGLHDQIRDVNVQVQALDAFGQQFGPTRLRARRAGGAWLVDLRGAKIDGRIVWPAHPSPASRVVLALRHLAIQPAGGKGKSTGASMNPAKVPPLEVTADRLDYGGVDLGRLQLDTVPEPSGLKVERASLVSDWLQLRAHGDWQDHDGRQSSRFQITVAGGNLGKMLSAFGYAGNIKGGQTHGDISANWRGSPMAFSLKRLQGHLHLKIGEGRILRVEPGAGRVFGLLSLQALPRRLSLDFSDLFRKGFSFDSIEGNFTFSEGNAYTSDLVVKGPSARIDIAGRTGLVARDYDQLVTVIPHIRSSLPIAGVIAGGPAVGAALLLMDKLFPGPLTELTSLANYQYTLTGSWDDPVVKRLHSKAGSAPASDQ